MMLHRWVAVMLTCVLMTGCATEASVVLQNPLRSTVRQQPIAVLFTDDVGRIRYYVTTVRPTGLRPLSAEIGPQPDRFAVYEGAWQAGPALTAIHTDELHKRGVAARSVYDLLGADATARLTAAGRDSRGRNYEIPPQLTPELAEALTMHGERYLLWVTWSGLNYVAGVLNTAPEEHINSSYWLFDLESRALVWHGGLADTRDSGFHYADATTNLEDNQFAGFRRLAERWGHQTYEGNDDSVPWLLGLGAGK